MAKKATSNRKKRPSLQQQLNAAQASVEELQAEVKSLNERLGAEKSHVSKLQAQIKERDDELADAGQELEDARESRKNITKKISELEEQLQTLKEENDTLRKKAAAAEKERSRQLEEVKRELRDAERQSQKRQGEIDELGKNLRELNAQQASASEDIEETPKASSKASFIIDFYWTDTDFRGRITHPFSREQKALSGPEDLAILDFIQRHLAAIRPQKPEAETNEIISEGTAQQERVEPSTLEAAEASNSEATDISTDEAETVEKTTPMAATPRSLSSDLKSTSARPGPRAFQDIRFRQGQGQWGHSSRLEPNIPADLAAKLALSTVTDSEHPENQGDAFVVRMLVVDTKANQPVAGSSVCNDFVQGTEEYNLEMAIPKLQAGQYRVKLYAILPHASKLESEFVDIEVG